MNKIIHFVEISTYLQIRPIELFDSTSSLSHFASPGGPPTLKLTFTFARFMLLFLFLSCFKLDMSSAVKINSVDLRKIIEKFPNTGALHPSLQL